LAKYDKKAIILYVRGGDQFVREFPARVIKHKGKMALEVLVGKKLLGLRKQLHYLDVPESKEALQGRNFYVYVSPVEDAFYPVKAEVNVDEMENWEVQFKPIPVNLRFLYINNIKKITEKASAHESIIYKYAPIIGAFVVGIIAIIVFKLAFDGAAALLAQGNAACAANVKEAIMAAVGSAG